MKLSFFSLSFIEQEKYMNEGQPLTAMSGGVDTQANITIHAWKYQK